MNNKTEKITFTAIMLALSTALSLIPAIQLPLGGKATLASMLPVILAVRKYGTGWGIFTAVTYSLIQLALSFAKVLSWGLAPAVFIGCVLFDYLLPYSALMLSGLFKHSGKKGALFAAATALAVRFLFHFLSGLILWGYITEKGLMGAVIYSAAYNGAFMLPELFVTLAALAALIGTGAYDRIMKKIGL